MFTRSHQDKIVHNVAKEKLSFQTSIVYNFFINNERRLQFADCYSGGCP